MVLIKLNETLFLIIMDGLKNLITRQVNLLFAFFTPSSFTSYSNCSIRSPSIPSNRSGGQMHLNRLSNLPGGDIISFSVIESS